jgi:hypothetical protein
VGIKPFKWQNLSKNTHPTSCLRERRPNACTRAHTSIHTATPWWCLLCPCPRHYMTCQVLEVASNFSPPKVGSFTLFNQRGKDLIFTVDLHSQPWGSKERRCTEGKFNIVHICFVATYYFNCSTCPAVNKNCVLQYVFEQRVSMRRRREYHQAVKYLKRRLRAGTRRWAPMLANDHSTPTIQTTYPLSFPWSSIGKHESCPEAPRCQSSLSPRQI